MSLLIDNHEVEERQTEYGIKNTTTGDVIECETQEDAEFDALLYPNAVVVRREVYVTKWAATGAYPD